MKRVRRDLDDQASNDGFELYAEDVWEDDDVGRFAKARWSEGPRRRRSEWLRRRLEEARSGMDDELGYSDLRGFGG